MVLEQIHQHKILDSNQNLSEDEKLEKGEISLADKLKELLKEGLINDEDKAYLTKTIKFMGDKAVHRLKVPRRNELAAGLLILEVILNKVYSGDTQRLKKLISHFEHVKLKEPVKSGRR